MVASISGSAGGVTNRADAIFSRLDTNNQGYIDKAGLASVLSATGEADAGAGTGTVDDMFGALDGDSDGKVTKSELTEAMTKVSDQLNAQFDAARVQGGMPPGPSPGGASSGAASGDGGDGGVDAAGAAGGMPSAGGMGGAGGPRGAGGAGATEETDSTGSTEYVAAADTDGDGTVSDAEQAAYDKKLASGEIDKNGNETGKAGGTGSARQQDPARELAQALHVLKAYAENGGDSDASAASTGNVSVAV